MEKKKKKNAAFVVVVDFCVCGIFFYFSKNIRLTISRKCRNLDKGSCKSPKESGRGSQLEWEKEVPAKK